MTCCPVSGSDEGTAGMAIDPQDDIMRDFLIESREILDGLSEQLVELERHPQDRDLLNAVFRGFHTIKGGAGFLSLEALVEICHQTEDIFNLLRQGDKVVTPELMDTVLQALDRVNAMFVRLDSGEELEVAPTLLMEQLRRLNVPDGPGVHVSGETGVSSADGDVTDQEFERLLDELAVAAKPPEPLPPEPSGVGSAPGISVEITEAEFEDLLDQLHGEGGHPGKSVPAAASSEEGDSISETEFEGLLDQLYGVGNGPDAVVAVNARAGVPSRSESVPSLASAAAPSAVKVDTGEQRSGQRGEATVRVDTAKLDDIMNLVGELVLVRNRLSTLRGQLNDARVSQAVGNLEQVSCDLQNAVMKTRMQPIKKVFSRFPRVVRDLARTLHKEIQLTIRGEDTDLDKNLVEALADPLVHLVRNAIDHGLEEPEERVRLGKPRIGSLVLSAAQEGDHILLIIADDGRGMDPEALRVKAIDKGLLDPDAASRLDDEDSLNLIFLPGFSTKDQISDVSGRGVGMDVVKDRLARLNGTVEIDSKLGEGTTLRIKVPLTLVILPTLMVQVGNCKCALPMPVVQEIFELNSSRAHMVDGRLTVMIRRKAMPLFFLERWLAQAGESLPMGVDEARDNERQVVTIVLGHQVIGLVVDEVVGLEEVVIKPLGTLLQGLPGLTGSTITGDGRIALIVDIPGLIKHYGPAL